MLAWILNLDFAAGALGVGQGPYWVAAGRVAHAGASAGQTFTCGSQAGQIHA